MRVVLVAEEAAGIQTLRLIAAREGVELVAVATGAPSGTGRGVVVADVADKLGCARLPAEQVRDPAFAGWLRDRDVDLLVNVHSLCVMHEDVVVAPRLGSFNLHPGPLPAYAGLDVPSWAIFNGERRHAVTLHWMASGIDTGAIAYQAWFDLDSDATGLSCSLQCMRLGVPLVERLLTAALQEPEAIPSLPQDNARRVVYRRGQVPFDGRIDWNRPAATLDAFIRAADYHPMPSPWGHPQTSFEGEPLDVVKVRRTGRPCEVAPGTLAAGEAGMIEVATADEWLILQRIRRDGRILPVEDSLQEGGRLEPLSALSD